MPEKIQISLAAARVNAGLTQNDMAQKMGVSNKTIVNWEKGKIRPKAAQFHYFCELAGIDPDYIFLPHNET